MDITQFYDIKTVEDVQKDAQKENRNKKKDFFKKLVRDKMIAIDDYDFCDRYIDSDCLLVNSQKFDQIIEKIGEHKFQTEIKNIYRANQSKNIIETFMDERKDVIFFVDERINALEKLIEFIKNDSANTFGLYGYAGTGKTTMTIEFVRYLLEHTLIKSIAFSAPTHKALNVMKTNFDMIVKRLLKKFDITETETFDCNLDLLQSHGMTIKFKTIHSLLGFSMDHSETGERVFKKKSPTTINEYNIVIIDECSMISLQMMICLMEEIRKLRKNDLSCPKIIFTGDPAQLPPVEEISSALFIKNKNDITLETYTNNVSANVSTILTQDNLIREYENFVTKMFQIPTITLEHIFRNTKVNVNQVCNTIRQWVVSGTRKSFTKYVGNGVYLYRQKGERTETEWFKKCTEYFKSGNTSNIILTWTNKNSDLYNNVMRNRIIGKKKIEPFEIGDRLILKDFYKFSESKEQETSTCFYTSDQIQICDISTETKIAQPLKINTPPCVQRLKNSQAIMKKMQQYVSIINANTKKIYKVWKMTVTRMPEHDVSDEEKGKENKYQIYVIHTDSTQDLTNDKTRIESIIKKLTNIFKNSTQTQYATIERYLIKQLWTYMDMNYISPYANVIFGYSITTHKSQGSTFSNVFVDVRDILTNTDENVAKRCVYTAFSRCSNELHILA